MDWRDKMNKILQIICVWAGFVFLRGDEDKYMIWCGFLLLALILKEKGGK